MEVKLDLQHIGTRYEHYRDLLDLWEEGLRILQNMNQAYKFGSETEMEEDLETAIKVFKRHLDNMADFSIMSVYRQIEDAHKDVDKNPE